MTEESFDVPNLEQGIYEHYKGNRYELIGVGIDTETELPVVIYKPLYETNVPYWVRPYKMFVDAVEQDGTMIPRFRKVA